MKNNYLFILILFFNYSFGQQISLLEQFNGRFDFTIIGNTLNLQENNSVPGQPPPPCVILTSSSANLFLNSSQVVEKAYLYWAGDGTGINQIKLNNQVIIASDVENIVQSTSNLVFFRAIKDVTAQILATGNGTYTVSDFDLTNTIIDYCPNTTNFGGWAIVIVYRDNSLPLNQLNIYSGLDYVGFQNNSLTINLNSLNVIDNVGAKIGFLAWEGDKNLANNETLKINGTALSNAINPINNAFNGTNSITGASNLYNMDIDVYDIQGNIAIGDTSASIQLTSNQDFVMISTVVTKLNSQLPDATITIRDFEQSCNSRTLKVNYTVFNTNGTNFLPANASIAIFANDVFIQSIATQSIIPIGGSENGSVMVTIPNAIPSNFVLKFIVDSNQNGIGSITEINENNNIDNENISLWELPKFNFINDLKSCDIGFGKGLFDFSSYSLQVKQNQNDDVRFFASQNEAENNTNPIFNSSNFNSSETPQTIFVRVEDNNGCYVTTNFKLFTNKCPPKVYNLVSDNGDGDNDIFFVSGLRDIFLQFKISIYNRYGAIVWTGNNNTADWSGIANQGALTSGNQLPVGTYFYVLELNDAEFPQPMQGFVYLTR